MSAQNREYGEQERFSILIGRLPVWAIRVKRAGRKVVSTRLVREFIEKMCERFIKTHRESLPEHLREWRIVLQHHRRWNGDVLCLFWSHKDTKWQYYWSGAVSGLVGEFVILTPNLPWLWP